MIVQRARALLAVAASLARRCEEITATQKELDAAILAKAFQGTLVPQDPIDEPVDAMLARLRARKSDTAVGSAIRAVTKRGKQERKSMRPSRAQR